MSDDIEDGKWNVRLRDDQMDCVIECLTWLISRHDLRMARKDDAVSLDEFAHAQAKARIEDALKSFTEIGHRA